jgi:hypothetical protein
VDLRFGLRRSSSAGDITCQARRPSKPGRDAFDLSLDVVHHVGHRKRKGPQNRSSPKRTS